MSNDQLLITAVKFLKDQATGMEYGEIGVTLVIYSGRITRVEKSIVEKEQADDNQSKSRRV